MTTGDYDRAANASRNRICGVRHPVRRVKQAHLLLIYVLVYAVGRL